MKFILVLMLLALGCACKPTQDPSAPPATLNHQRLLFNVNGEVMAGLAGTASNVQPKILTYFMGSYFVDGVGDCDYHYSEGYNGNGWMPIRLPTNFNSEVCLFHVQLRVNDMDAPATGLYLVRKFSDPNVVALKIQTERQSIRYGYGLIQTAKQTYDGAISSNRKIRIWPTGKKGVILINGCGMSKQESFDFTTNGGKYYDLSLQQLYSGHSYNIDSECMFDILVNNDDYVKEGASLYVHTYDKAGSFLEAPVPRDQGDGYCFDFNDPYVIAMSANGYYDQKWNVRSQCVPSSENYEVMGVTSVQRLFYGIYNPQVKEWVVLK